MVTITLDYVEGGVEVITANKVEVTEVGIEMVGRLIPFDKLYKFKIESEIDEEMSLRAQRYLDNISDRHRPRIYGQRS